MCEADSDSRFYAAVLDVAREADGLPPHDLLFTQAGGKHRLPTVVNALRAVDVPVAVIADIDLLRDEEPLRTLVRAQGGDWDAIRPTWARVAAGVTAMGASPLVPVVLEAVTEILGENDDAGRLSRSQIESVREAVRLTDGWSTVKRGGLADLPGGQLSEDARDLVQQLADLRLHVVPVGTLERWVPTIAGHGPTWVSNVLDANDHATPGLAAREFVTRIAAAFE